MHGYFYKGRHRKPTNTGRRVAVVSVASAIGVGATLGTAQAQDWDPIIQCESGGDPTVKNPTSTASGLYQFINGTWAAYGGEEFAPTAREATTEQQTIVANRAFAAEGYRPWASSESCWGSQVETRSEPKREQKPSPVKRNKPTAPSIPAEAKPSPPGEGGYVVVEGDTLSGIAAKVRVDHWSVLADANPDVIEHPDWIFPSETLVVPR